MPAGEASKSFERLQQVVEAILESRRERNDVVVALGGGVVGDLAGFAAAITRRGMRFVQIPTSLLAQVDSSVGGKTGINARHGKNLVGAFMQPALVLADTSTLDTLPEREFRAGYAEMAKAGLIGDRKFFEWLEANRAKVFAGGPERVRAIAEACASRPAPSPRTSWKLASGRCSISATPSRMRSRRPADTILSGWSMARRCRSASSWRTIFQRRKD